MESPLLALSSLVLWGSITAGVILTFRVVGNWRQKQAQETEQLVGQWDREWFQQGAEIASRYPAYRTTNGDNLPQGFIISKKIAEPKLYLPPLPTEVGTVMKWSRSCGTPLVGEVRYDLQPYRGGPTVGIYEQHHNGKAFAYFGHQCYMISNAFPLRVWKVGSDQPVAEMGLAGYSLCVGGEQEFEIKTPGIHPGLVCDRQHQALLNFWDYTVKIMAPVPEELLSLLMIQVIYKTLTAEMVESAIPANIEAINV